MLQSLPYSGQIAHTSKVTTVRAKTQYRKPPNLGHLNLSKGSVKIEQKTDPFTSQIVEFLNIGVLPDDNKQARALLLRQEHYVLIDNILFHIFIFGPKISTTSAQIVIPQNLKEQILPFHHESTISGLLWSSRML